MSNILQYTIVGIIITAALAYVIMRVVRRFGRNQRTCSSYQPDADKQGDTNDASLAQGGKIGVSPTHSGTQHKDQRVRTEICTDCHADCPLRR